MTRVGRSSFDKAFRNSMRKDVEDLADSFYNLTDDGGVVNLTDAATITWDTNEGWNAKVTLGGNRTLAIVNPLLGAVYNILITQDATGSRTITLPGNSKVFAGGAGAIVLTTTGGATDMLSAYYNGTSFYWTYALNFT